MSNLEIIAVIVSLIAVALTILRSTWCWYFNIAASLLYGDLFFEYRLYGEVLLQVIFVLMSVYGLRVWWKTKQHDHDITVEPLPLKRLLLQLIFAAIFGIVFGWVLHQFTNAALPILDAQLASFSLLATYWTSKKHIATWPLWVVVDTIYVAVFIYKGLFLTAGLYGAFVAMAVYGWYMWQQAKTRQQQIKDHGLLI
ncbi:nicotinamide riboside transporter PnuC [Acinetobacter rathckeae]|uniref:nicotinamide riboside transporter PnuC n=1 Tax=Acinetobacter rathckeae TaxID=2605272 RepID=UPI0018A2E65C|nr:nicotinamide riboside transporter PnuC [Acinetobacter rathckeae]MBF7686885.1 nicotinamide mononucleotide transporter [Acinetobacter rathckeae]MBF7694711.1 nicotinamide mononucleotide transporter [Acinetobacter rathckeae]